MADITTNLDTSELDDDVLKILQDDAGITDEVVTTENIDQSNADYLATFGLSLDAMKEGADMRAKREAEGKQAYYKDVFQNFIVPNELLMQQIQTDTTNLYGQKYGSVDNIDNFLFDELKQEVIGMTVDRMFDQQIPQVMGAYENYINQLEADTPAKEAMLLGGIDENLKMNIGPRIITELVGPNADINVKKDLVKAVLMNANPGMDPSLITVGTFNEITGGTYKGENGNMLAYRIGNGLVQPVNVPGMDSGDMAMIIREIPNIIAGITGGVVGSPGGILGSAGGAATGVAITELIVNSIGHAYSLQAKEGDISEEQIVQFIKDNYKNVLGDVAMAATFEAAFGVAIPGIARFVKRFVAKRAGALPPNQLVKAYETFQKAGGEVNEASVNKVNKILQDELGPNAPQVDITILQAFKSGAVPVTNKALSQTATPYQITAFDLAQVQIIKEVSDAFTELSKKTAKGDISDVPDFAASPQILFGNDFIAAANKITQQQLDESSSLFVNPYNELNAILYSVVKTADGETFNPNMIAQTANKFTLDMIQKQNNKIATLLEGALGKDPLNVKFIKPQAYRQTAYSLIRTLNKSFMKDMDKGQREALKSIIDQVSIFTKSTPGPGKIKAFSYAEIDSLLNDLNDIIDNPGTYGALAKKNKVVSLASSLRDDLYGAINREFRDKFGLQEGPAKFKEFLNTRNFARQLNNLKNSDLLMKVLRNDEIGFTQGGQNLFMGMMSSQAGKKQLGQISYLFNEIPELAPQKELFKESILQTLAKALDGETGDGLQTAINNKDFTSINKIFKKWINENGAIAEQFFSPAEWKQISKGGINAVNKLKQLTSDRAALNSYIKGFTGKIGSMEYQSLYKFFQDNPTKLNEFITEGIKRKVLSKEMVNNFRRYSMMQFNNKTMVQAGEGIFIFDPKALKNEISSKPEFYRELFGDKWLNSFTEMADFLDQYYSPVIGALRNGDAAVADALKNVFLGQLDRRRTMWRGVANFMKILDTRGFVNFYKFEDFKNAYKNANLSTTAMNVSQIIESSTAGVFRGDEDRQSEAMSDTANAAIITGAVGASALNKGGEMLGGFVDRMTGGALSE